MLRPLIIIINLWLAFFAFQTSGTPTATVKTPAPVKAGSSFTVQVTINPNGVTDFMRYAMVLPKGWTAEKGETAGASFMFEDSVVKFIWSRVGDAKKLDLSFKVNVPAGAVSGDYTLAHKISHVVNNLPDNVVLDPVTIKVSGTSPATTVTTTSTQNSDSTAKPPAAITAERVVPTDTVKGEFEVSISVYKDDIKGFGKIEDSLPNGFTAEAINKDGADFEFKNGVVRFSWFNIMPSRSTLNIKYKVVVSPDVQGPQTIKGHFAYVENESGKVLDITPSVVLVKGNPKAMASTDKKQQADTASSSTPPPVTTTTTTTTAKMADTTGQSTVSSGQNTGTTADTTSTVATSASTATATAVKYSVQIAAMRRMVPVNYYSSTYHIASPINVEQIDGLNKYTNGSFTEYKGARDHRETLRGKGVQGPFVAAYNSGKRITVQEALMISNQKWIQ